MIEGKGFTVIFGNFLGAGDLSSLVYVLLAAVSFAVARFSLVPLLNRAMERTKTQWDVQALNYEFLYLSPVM
jgi:hypothetical protein